jgi:hypothetical protein
MLLVKPVLNFFFDTNFPEVTGENDRWLALCCIAEFCKDDEPYWVARKAQTVIFHLLHFAQEFAPKPNFEDSILDVIDLVQKQLREFASNGLEKAEDGIELLTEINPPVWQNLRTWKQHHPWNPERIHIERP